MGNNTLNDIELCAGFRRLLPRDRHCPPSMTTTLATLSNPSKHTRASAAAPTARASRCAPRVAQPGKGRVRLMSNGEQ